MINSKNIKAAPLTGSNPTAHAPITEAPKDSSKFILLTYYATIPFIITSKECAPTEEDAVVIDTRESVI